MSYPFSEVQIMDMGMRPMEMVTCLIRAIVSLIATILSVARLSKSQSFT